MTTQDRREGIALDELLAAATDDDPSPDQLARLDARLAPLLGPPGGGGSPGSDGAGAGGGGAAAAGGSALGKWLLAGVAAAGLGAGGYAVVKSRRHQAAPVARTAAADAAPAHRETGPVDASPVAADAGPPPPVKTPRPAPAAPESAAEALAAETRLLERAQTGLRDGAPAAALRSVDAHRKRFPKGVLAEERERLAIEALLALGRRPEAEARARRFRKDFPGSVQWQRIRDLLDAAR